MTDSGPAPDEDGVTTPDAVLGEGRKGAGSVTVVGTAHVSHDSVAEVEETIEREQPDVVAVELDEGRYRQLKGETPDDLDPSDVLSGNTIYQFLAYWLLSYVQTRLGERFDIEPGADMLAAVETAEANGIDVALVDREIQETIQRLWKRMRFREKLRLLGGLVMELADPLTVGLSIGVFLGTILAIPLEALAGPFLIPTGIASGVTIPVVGGLAALLLTLLDGLIVVAVVGVLLGVPIAGLIAALAPEGEEVEEIDMEALTDTDVVSAMMEEFRRFSPGGADALIDERDAFIAHRLVALRDQGYDVVAIVGAGHREGIEGYLANPETLPPMASLVGETSGGWRLSSLLYKAFGYLITLGFLAFFLLLAIAGVRSQFLLGLFAAWFLVNGIIAAGLARLAGAHWTSAGVGGAVAWLTSVNPLLAPGWFAGYVELRYIDVNVSDIGTLNDILGDDEAPIGELFDRMREVPLFRLIAIVAMTNVGSFIASMLFAFIFIPILSAPVGGVEGIADLMLQGAAESVDFLWGLVT
jgi:pheromone shutdown protein TraB